MSTSTELVRSVVLGILDELAVEDAQDLFFAAHKQIGRGVNPDDLPLIERQLLKHVDNQLTALVENGQIGIEAITAFYKEIQPKLEPQEIIDRSEDLNLPDTTAQQEPPLEPAYHIDRCMMDLTSINEAEEIPSLFVFDDDRDQKPSMFMPRGVVCVLASEGGMGKSLLSLHLGISLALQGEATKLRRAPDGYLERSRSKAGFALKPVPTSGKVVMLFAEEDQATCAYRLKQLLPKGHDGQVEESLLRALSGKLIPVPLCGMPEGVEHNLALSASQREPEDHAEERFQELHSMLNTIAGDDGLDLIVIDPLAQFGGGDFEKDNGEATKLMRQFQRLTSVKGKPTVLLVHHSSKDASKGKGKLSHAVRGSSALKDNSRWVGILRRINESESGETYLVDDHGRTVLELVVAKSNYGPCFQKARYLSHKSEIIAIQDHDLLTIKKSEDESTNKSSSKQQISSANDKFRRS